MATVWVDSSASDIRTMNNLASAPNCPNAAAVKDFGVNTTKTTNLLTDEAGFVSTDSLSPDFLKLLSSSPAVDNGPSLPGLFEDFNGAVRSIGRPDIGACESGGPAS